MATESQPTQTLRSPVVPPDAASTGLPLAQLAWKTGTNQGPRKENQDCVLAVTPQNPNLAAKGVLLVVCDGVGGEDGGHIAANTAANEAMRAYYDEPAADPLQALQIAIDRAQLAVHAEATKTPRFGSMATTIVMAAIHNNYLYVGHVGDSRAYIFRGGQLAQLTRDHTFVNAQIESGGMTVEQAQRSIYKSTLVRSLGAKGNHTADYRTEVLQPGDRVLLCSDGLYGVVADEQIAQLLAQHAQPNNAASHLIGAAVTNQTGDNVSVAVLGYGTPAAAQTGALRAAQSSTKPSQPIRPGWVVPLGVGAGALVVAVIALLALRTVQPGPDAPPTPTRVAGAAGGVVVSAATQPPAAQPVVAVTQAPGKAPGADASPTPESAPAQRVITPTPVPEASPTLGAPDEPTATREPSPTPTATPRPLPTRPPATRTSVSALPTVDVAPQPTSLPSQPTSPPSQPTSPPQPPPQPTSVPPPPPPPPPTPPEREP